MIEFDEQRGDRGIELCEREEGAVAKPRENPALDQLHAGLCLGFVARTSRARRDHRHAVVSGELAISRIEFWLVAVRMRDRALEVIRDGDLGHPAEELKAAHV